MSFFNVLISEPDSAGMRAVRLFVDGKEITSNVLDCHLEVFENGRARMTWSGKDGSLGCMFNEPGTDERRCVVC